MLWPYNPSNMPVYEYACTSCGERTEAKQGFDDPPLEVCPICGEKLRRLYSPVGIVFKGSGFYATDTKKKPEKDSDRPAEKPAEKKAEKKAKAETKTSASAKEKSA